MIVEYIINLIVQFMEILGYPGLLILMALESMIAPVPSEVVMPFAGFLIAEGKFTFLMVAIFSTLGSMMGSLISYWLGLFGGRKFVNKFGKYLLLDESHLDWTEKWFERKGEKTIFISRFVPIVRHLISIPAGIGKMNLKKFILYTVVGALIWNMFLVYLGFKLKQRWELIHEYSPQLDILAGIILLIVIGYFIYRHVKQTKIKRISS
ncbi:MAG TPA: DedA family protein [Candidatus Nanoarchaeia archaeon]|nr:DedA family protein [Candidatus Nanoarchaeia archaeon]